MLLNPSSHKVAYTQQQSFIKWKWSLNVGGQVQANPEGTSKFLAEVTQMSVTPTPTSCFLYNGSKASYGVLYAMHLLLVWSTKEEHTKVWFTNPSECCMVLPKSK